MPSDSGFRFARFGGDSGGRSSKLGTRVAMSASEISRIERGAAHRVPIRTLERILEALGARLYLRVLWRGEELDRLLDHEHALIIERISLS